MVSIFLQHLETSSPVLAKWQYGLGKTIAYTSDLSGKWAGEFASWDNWPLFLNQLITDTLPNGNSEPYSITVDTQNSETLVHLTSSNNNGLPIKTQIVSQSGDVVDTSMKMTAPGKYNLTMEQKPGLYFLSVKERTEDGESKVFKTGFTVPYSEELLMKGNRFSLLQEAAELTGGKQLENSKEAFAALPEKTERKQSIAPWFILLAFLFLFIEIAVRRFGCPSFGILKWKFASSKEKRKGLVGGENRRPRMPTHTTDKNQADVTKDNNLIKSKVSHQVNRKQTQGPKDQQNNRQENMKRLLAAKKKKR
ncbi:hypothetical protein MUB24_12475 [Lederbergia sp. NSJ-179]|uniref:hypothetical protein n=1 Tax=Lederbergia sp. NSJ-179 TaxID=2931402 RepID=UPI001FD57E91|nr:hypothetical protein [Lederbergia sp. NSJ-179]MCJ7841696.1 hypothetical protein [Lederbergia sp. NSJ-179]